MFITTPKSDEIVNLEEECSKLETDVEILRNENEKMATKLGAAKKLAQEILE